ncbi:hypothetical protein PoB_003808800 [Plakobranchus ocellatus]|uniref:Secreted protein n=1 Tax=Plakobranchus ocellatus TaxID=259542 RepID=A0AAV4AXK1_9GAST|nr:hypothetical protein PoB_003808800 [Plakobranchus ocellatus]
MLATALFIFSCVISEIHPHSHCHKDSCLPDLAAFSDHITVDSDQVLPPGLQDCLEYLFCSQDAIQVLRELGQSVYKLDLLTISKPDTLDVLCQNVQVMKACENLHWKDTCEEETGSRGRKYDAKFMEWICNKRSRLQNYSECWAHPGFTPRVAACVKEYSDISDIINCFEEELEPEEECSDAAIAFVRTMATKYMPQDERK